MNDVELDRLALKGVVRIQAIGPCDFTGEFHRVPLQFTIPSRLRKEFECLQRRQLIKVYAIATDKNGELIWDIVNAWGIDKSGQTYGLFQPPKYYAERGNERREYVSTIAAAEDHGCSHTTIGNHIRRNTKDKAGWKWGRIKEK